MIYKIHQLYCGSFCLDHTNDVFPCPELACRCLLIESDAGLILCDTGLPKIESLSLTGRLTRRLLKTKSDPESFCVNQIRNLGFDIKDVRHIVLTHLDTDHAGALMEFPWAQIHLHELEKQYVNHLSLKQKLRYNNQLFPKNLNYKSYSVFGESWNGFDGVQPIEELADNLLFIPLVGHTMGHSGIAINTGAKWLFHCGDAFYFKEDLNSRSSNKNLASEIFQTGLAMDNNLRLRTSNRLTLLHQNKPDIKITNSHDPRLDIFLE